MIIPKNMHNYNSSFTNDLVGSTFFWPCGILVIGLIALPPTKRTPNVKSKYDIDIVDTKKFNNFIQSYVKHNKPPTRKAAIQQKRSTLPSKPHKLSIPSPK